MNNDELKKAQQIQLEIAKEIKRVCDLHNINYFLDSGTLLGAVRHKGFIPWDDDLDIGMLFEDYTKFIEEASYDLSDLYFVQTWDNDPYYPLPFLKVRKKGTSFREKKSNNKELDGVYVDVFPYLRFDGSFDKQKTIARKLMFIFRILLMKCGNKPWSTDTGFSIGKVVFYIPFKIISLFFTKKKLIKKYKKILPVLDYDTKLQYLVCAEPKPYYYESKWAKELVELQFEDCSFKCSKYYHEILTSYYGTYMQLPPESERENRHIVINPSF